MKDEVRTDDDWHAWRIWKTTRDRLCRLRQLVPHCSFLVRKESLRASMTRSERKSMLYRYSFLEVSKMCQLAERKRGSKSRMPLLAHSCQSVRWTLTISCWRRSESRRCVEPWEHELVSTFHHDWSWTFVGVFVCLWGGGCFSGFVFDVLDLSVVSFVYLRQLTLRYNDCHYRDDERSISPKKNHALAQVLSVGISPKPSVFNPPDLSVPPTKTWNIPPVTFVQNCPLSHRAYW